MFNPKKPNKVTMGNGMETSETEDYSESIEKDHEILTPLDDYCDGWCIECDGGCKEEGTLG